MFTFLASKISTLMFLIFLTLFIKRKYSITKTVLVETLAFFLTCAVEYLAKLIYGDMGDQVGKISTVVILMITMYIVSLYKDSRVLFMGIICLCYTLPGNVLGYIVCNHLGSQFGGILVQLMTQILFLAFCVIYFQKRLLSAYEKKVRNWGVLTLAPLAYFLSVAMLTKDPVPGQVTVGYIIGLLALLSLPVTILIILAIYARRDQLGDASGKTPHYLGAEMSIFRDIIEFNSAFRSFYRMVVTVFIIFMGGNVLFLFYTNLDSHKVGKVPRWLEMLGIGPGRNHDIPLTEQGAFWVLIVMVVILICLSLFGMGYYAQRRSEYEIQQKDRQLIYEIMDAFVGFVDAKDTYTAGHSNRVAEYSRLIAQKLNMSDAEVMQVYYCGLLHDCGKISIPERILNKPGRLDDSEFEVIKSHTVKGYEILRNLSSLPSASTAARSHHERYDGKGYPDGKRGEEIPLIARIVSIADAFDAMNYSRVYRPHLTRNQILSELKRNRGTQFDPRLVDALLSLINEGKVYIYSGGMD